MYEGIYRPLNLWKLATVNSLIFTIINDEYHYNDHRISLTRRDGIEIFVVFDHSCVHE